MLSLIVAMDENQLIGKDNALPWHLPADLKFFKMMTINHTVVMGRKTFESIGRPLPNRRNIVLTRDKSWENPYGIETYCSIEEMLEHIVPTEKTFIIGGADIFRQMLPYVQEMLITEVHHCFEGDTYFPAFNRAAWIVNVLDEGIADEKNQYAQTYLQFVRKNGGIQQ